MKANFILKLSSILAIVYMSSFELNAQSQNCFGFTSCNGFNNPYSCFSCGNCVWYARNQVDCRWGVNIDMTQSAKFWAPNAINQGYTVSNIPVVNSVACSSIGQHGHVAIVEEILDNGNKVRVSEMNYQANTSCPNYGGAGVRTVVYNTSWFNQGFIHPPFLSKPIMSNISLYGGHTNSPKVFYANIKESDFPGSFTHSMLSNFKISGSGFDLTIPTSRIINEGQITIQGTLWRRLKVQLQSSDIPFSIADNINRTVSFDLTSSGQTIRFENKNLYFANFNASGVFQDISDLNNWAKAYIVRGANLGLFKGTSLQTFNPSGNLERQHAAKVIVEAAVRLRLLNIDANTTNGTFSDVPLSNPFFIHIQTLRNYGYINASTHFNPTQSISVAQMCKIISNVFQIQSTDFANANYLNLLQRKIIPYSSDASLIPYMSNILKLVDVRESAPGFLYGENVWDFLDFSLTNSVIGSPIQVNGDVPISRAVMAKFMTNLVIWKVNKLGITTFRTESEFNDNYYEFDNIPLSGQSLDDIVSFGEKYDNAPLTATSSPTVPSQQSYSVPSGGSLTLAYNAGTFPQHYFWSMQKNGATLTSNNSQHSSITFTAPNVSTPTQWKLYTYTANNKGKAIETNITINVGGSSGGSSSAPTQQAHSLNLYNVSQNSMTANWTRGNGQFCLVTCKEVGANSQDLPDAGVVYNGNSNFSSAPPIFSGSDTKVVYTGTGSFVNITGLNPNTQYQIAVFEYNGTTPSTVFYNLNNAPISTLQTLNPNSPNPPTVEISWSPEMPFTTNTNVTFTGSASGYTSLIWSVTGNATILSGQGTLSCVIAMGNAGNASVTLTANNSTTGLSNTANLYTQILNSNQILPDLIINNAAINSALIPNTNFTVEVQQKNQGAGYLNSTSTWTKFYLSDDNVLNAGDFYFSSSDFVVNNAIPSQGVINFSKTITLPSWVETGNYFILVQADGAINVTESNENNNIFAIPVTVTNGPCDYFISSFAVTPPTLKSGQTFNFSINVQNTGTCINTFSGVDFYYSTDNILSTDDIKFGGYLMQFPQTTARTPNTISDGSYFLIAVVDHNFEGFGTGYNTNLESNENNNYFAIPITINNSGQPTINSSNFALTNVSETSLNFSWQNGNGVGRSVIANKNNVPFLPNDNTNYTPNTNFLNAPLVTSVNTSGSKFIYSGSNNNVTITGLEANQDYMFTAIDYNLPGPDYKHTFSNNSINISNSSSNYASEFIYTFNGNQMTNNWEKKTGYVTSYSIYQNRPIFFIDESTGYYLFGNVISKTIDGGKVWVAKQISNEELTSIHFIDNNIGFIAGNGVICKTVDAGQEWSKYNLPYYITSIEFSNNLIGYATGYASNEGVVLKTSNGGATWQVVYSSANKLITLSVVGNNVWVGGENRRIFKSSNSGVTWSDISINNVNWNLAISKIQFINSNIGWASIENHSFNGNTLYFKTIDGGINWLTISITSTGTGLSDFEFLDQNLGYAIGPNWFAKTINGGNTWQLQPSSTSMSGNKIKTILSNKLAVINNNGLFISTTGGQSNSINANLQNSNVCQGSNVILDYNILGTFNTNNIFNVELSNNQGNFSSPTILYSFTNTGSNSININIPNSVIAGNFYKLRIVALNPSLISNETNAFSITSAPNIDVSIAPINILICPNQSVTFTATPINGGTSPTYTWKKNGIVVGTNLATYSDNSLINGDIVWAEMVSNQSCASTVPAISVPSNIEVTQIDDLFIQAIDNILSASTDLGVQWYRNGQPIPGATSEFYEATQTGFYQYSVTINGCTVMSEIYNLETLSIDEITNSLGAITIYPNPSADKVNVVSNIYTIEEVRLFNLNGQVILTSKSNDLNHSVDISDYSQGVYILEVRTTDGLEKFKIIKK